MGSISLMIKMIIQNICEIKFICKSQFKLQHIVNYSKNLETCAFYIVVSDMALYKYENIGHIMSMTLLSIP